MPLLSGLSKLRTPYDICVLASFLMNSCSTEPNQGQLEMQKGQMIEDRHAESWDQCAGHSDGDTQQPHCFFSLVFSSFTLLLFFTIL
jgi:hypothetical protein